jgi:hypothetical protein
MVQIFQTIKKKSRKQMKPVLSVSYTLNTILVKLDSSISMKSKSDLIVIHCSFLESIALKTLYNDSVSLS